MEIHTPDHAPETWKETVKHLAMITAGVLIALAFEGVVSWTDHRLLVREARENIAEEIRSNGREIQSFFSSLEHERKELDAADRVAQALLERRKPDGLLELNWNFAELKNAAVTTGQITGAFGYMRYDEVKRFAAVYDLQAQYLRMQEREFQNFEAALAFVRRIDDTPPPSPASIEEWRARIAGLFTALAIQEQTARVLLKRYDELLK